jgi:Family of unknown function (DUF6941)
MKVTILLADAAQAAEGKLYVLGGGWSITGPDPSPMALAIKIEVPWDQANTPHTCRLELLDSDGQSVVAEMPEGEQPIFFEANFEVGRPPGVKPGTPIDLPLAVNMPPVPLDPGGRYEWRLSIDGRTEPDWRVAFSTRPRE